MKIPLRARAKLDTWENRRTTRLLRSVQVREAEMKTTEALARAEKAEDALSAMTERERRRLELFSDTQMLPQGKDSHEIPQTHQNDVNHSNSVPVPDGGVRNIVQKHDSPGQPIVVAGANASGNNK